MTTAPTIAMRRYDPRANRLASRRLLYATLVFAVRAAAAPETDDAAETNIPSAGDPVSTGDGRVVALNEEGHALYALGDYRRAVERFLQAYAIEPDPNLLFNIASCYEGLGDTDAAIEKYVTFLDGVGADHEGRPRAERAIEVLLTSRETPPAATKPTTLESRAAKPTPSPPARSPDLPVREPKWLPWVGLGGGAALGVLGVTVYALGASDHEEVSGARGFGDPNAVASLTRSQADDLIRSGNSKKAIGVTLASVGGALAASYLVWWLIDPFAETSAGGVDVAFDRSGMSVMLSECF